MRRRTMFGHVRRLPEVTAAHMALHLAERQDLVTALTTGRSGNTWPASPSVDATTGSRHRTRHWCRMGHSQWKSSMEGTTTHRRSSGPM